MFSNSNYVYNYVWYYLMWSSVPQMCQCLIDDSTRHSVCMGVSVSKMVLYYGKSVYNQSLLTLCEVGVSFMVAFRSIIPNWFTDNSYIVHINYFAKIYEVTRKLRIVVQMSPSCTCTFVCTTTCMYFSHLIIWALKEANLGWRS